MSCQIISIVNFKRGIGKTTISQGTVANGAGMVSPSWKNDLKRIFLAKGAHTRQSLDQPTRRQCEFA
jgi:hypothetical protein